MAALFATLSAIMSLLGLVFYRRCLRKNDGPSLPPGPKPWPIIGNLMDLPPRGVLEFQHWLHHKSIYGPISSVSVMGQTLVLIHDRKAASYLMEKMSLKTSNRPTTKFAYELCGFGEFISGQQYNSHFRRCRRIMHQHLGTKTAVARFHDTIEVEVRRFLLRVLDDPRSLIKHLRTKAGAIILNITYGYSVEPRGNDPLVDLIESTMANLILATVPLAWMVDIFPGLRYLPDRFPGAAFKETGREWKRTIQAAAEIPYLFVRRQLASGSFRMSFVSRFIHEKTDGDMAAVKLSRDDEHAIKWTAATLYAGGSDTMISTLSSFILAMILFPEVQRKAQEEIDRVMNLDRLPGFQDQDKLPYTSALVKEVFRWSPPGALGFPHSTSEDIMYNDYLIPKGAILIPSIWWFLHDPGVYVDPSCFKPERYLEPSSEPDPQTVAFGFGRRVCPGRLIASSSVFLTVAHMLAVFDIKKAIDELGAEIEPELKLTPGVINHVVEFPFVITPRNGKRAELVRSVEVEHPWGEGDSRHLGMPSVLLT